MAFYAIEIEECPGFGFQGGPEFSTNVQTLASGSEKRNADWAVCRHRYTVPFNNITDDAYLAIKRVFLLTRGKTHSFLFKDWGDYQATNEQFGTGDGSTKVFQLKKVSTVIGTSATYERDITKPSGTITVKSNGSVVTPSIDIYTGEVTFAVAPANGAVLTWSGEFRVQVRFDIDQLPFSLASIFRTGGFANTGSLDLVEVLNENDSAT